MNEKIFKTLGQIGASGIVVGIITVIVGVSVGVVSIISGARALKFKNGGNRFTYRFLKMYYRKYKSKKNGNENNQSIFQICSEGKRLGKE